MRTVYENRHFNTERTRSHRPVFAGYPATGAFPATIEEQTRQSLTNCKAVLEAAGAAMENVIKTTVFLSNMNNFAAMNGVYTTFFEGACPARSAVEVARLPKDALVEIECIAVL